MVWPDSVMNVVIVDLKWAFVNWVLKNLMRKCYNFKWVWILVVYSVQLYIHNYIYICAMGGKFEPMYECMYQLLKANLLKNKKMGVNASSKSWNSTYIYLYICNLSIQKRYYNGILIPWGKMKKTRKAKSKWNQGKSLREKGATDVTIRRRGREGEEEGGGEGKRWWYQDVIKTCSEQTTLIYFASLSLFLLFTIENPL